MSNARQALIACLALATLASGCHGCRGTKPSARSSETPRIAKKSDLTEAERKWGVAPPPPGNGIVYQPDVVRLDKGPEAVRAMSANALEWTIDGLASADLRPGKILFATSRVAGRILTATREGPHTRVMLGPVELTDIYRELKLTLTQPVDFGEAIQYDAPEYGGSTSMVKPRQLAERIPDEGARLVRAMFVPPAARLLPVSSNTPIRRFDVTPLVGPAGLGVQTTYDNGNVALTARGVLYLNAPSLHLNIDIAEGKVRVCELELRGAAGLLMSVDVASKVGLSGNFRHTEPSLPSDFSLPIVMNEFSPFAINVRQAFTVHTGFGAKGHIRSTGHYELAGSFRVGYRDGALSLGGLTRFSVKVNPAGTLEGVSLGATGMVLAHSVRVIVGVGAFGFATGPFVRLNSSLGISRDSDLVSMRMCRSASVGSSLSVGLGYVMPKAVTSAINFILRSLNLEEIKGEGGTESEPTRIIESHVVVPPIAACGAAPNGAK